MQNTSVQSFVISARRQVARATLLSRPKTMLLFITYYHQLFLLSLLFLLISISTIICAVDHNQTITTNSTTLAPKTIINDNNSSTLSNNDTQQQQQFKLDCQPGEQRQFSYESSTKVWGSAEQQVRLRATLRLKCMEAPTNTSLKYLVEIVKLTPSFISAEQDLSSTSSSSNKNNNDKRQQLRQDSSNSRRQHHLSKQLASQVLSSAQSRHLQEQRSHQLLHTASEQEAEIDRLLRAEPLLEEVGEVATRMKRSVSGWLSKAWGSVKDFFGNIFTSNERSSVSRDQVFKESGLDIMPGSCKASSSGSSAHKGTGKTVLPFDESVFEDLGPEYYVGASLDGTSAYDFSSAGHVSTFGPVRETNSIEDDASEMMNLSFFEDPLPSTSANRRRSKRAPGTNNSSKKSSRSASDAGGADDDHERQLRIPFVFVQSRDGKIVEIRFSAEESDLSIKNFKRHLCDLFTTNLDWNKSTQDELSPIGNHQTKYTLDSSANSMDSLKKTILKSAPGDDHEERTNKQQLVRVLAMVGTSDRRGVFLDKDEPGSILTDEDDDVDLDQQKRQDEGSRKSLSILRSINTTSSVQALGSKMLAPGIERMQVRIKQVQQINDGRLVGTAGQLSMSLVQAVSAPLRSKRHADGGDDSSRASMTRALPPVTDDEAQQQQQQAQVDDISDLLKVSTSFSMQLVPIPRKPDGSVDDDDSSPASSAAASMRSRRSAASASSGDSKSESSTQKPRTKKMPQTPRRTAAAGVVKKAPSDAQELQRVLQDLRKQEARLQMSSANLMAENSPGPQESQATRLEILRDQIRQRLNEEFVRNRIRRSLSAQQVAASVAASTSGGAARNEDDSMKEQQQQQRDHQRGDKSKQSPVSGDMGLGLTQLVLGTGVTTKRKGSIYLTIEEVLELESQLAEEANDAAISKLIRDTLKMDKLRQHCKSAIPSIEELASAGQLRAPEDDASVERRLPFGFREDELEDAAKRNSSKRAGGQDKDEIRAARRARQAVDNFAKRNDRKLEQCQRILRLVLKLNERQAIELALELIDACNQRLVASAKQEELGYGPMSKYYRRQRQQFMALLENLSRPSDSLLDKLLARLHHYPKLTQAPAAFQQSAGKQLTTRPLSKIEPEFVYVNTMEQTSGSGGGWYNKSLLKDEDDFNNNDGAAQLVMTLTSLAAKSSISRLKRLEVAEKLLGSLKGTSCSLFSSPDLDIIESMASFQEPLDEIVGRILQLARKCKQHDQYVVACVHGLSGQLQHLATQRFLGDLLKSPSSSCTLKSEIVLTLVGAQLINELKSSTQAQVTDKTPAALHPADQWPSSGRNKVDEILLEILESKDKQREPDRRCLRTLISHYLSKKRQQVMAASTTDDKSLRAAPPVSPATRTSRSKPAERRRQKRAVVNEHNFWDDAQCKKWTMPADGFLPSPELFSSPSENHFYATSPGSAHNEPTDLIDELDDNSILTALMSSSNNNNSSSSSRSARRRHQKLIERELDTGNSSSIASGGGSGGGQQAVSAAAFLRRRHKCVASKEFGPKNARANLKAEIVNDLVGAKDENKFLARFRLSTNFLGNQIDVGRMYLWHQRRTTRAYANILGRSIWDSSHACKDKAPNQVLYMPLFDFSLWLVKVSVGLRLNAEMGFYSNCDQLSLAGDGDAALPHASGNKPAATTTTGGAGHQAVSSRIFSEAKRTTTTTSNDELQLYPAISLKAAAEASAKLVVARVGMSLASQYSYQGDIRVSRQPDSCMSIYSAHQPMNITFSSWFQLWDNDCHFWGSRNRAEPSAIKWRLTGRKPIAWLVDECLAASHGAGGAKPQLPPATTAADNSTSGLVRINEDKLAKAMLSPLERPHTSPQINP